MKPHWTWVVSLSLLLNVEEVIHSFAKFFLDCYAIDDVKTRSHALVALTNGIFEGDRERMYSGLIPILRSAGSGLIEEHWTSASWDQLAGADKFVVTQHLSEWALDIDAHLLPGAKAFLAGVSRNLPNVSLVPMGSMRDDVLDHVGMKIARIANALITSGLKTSPCNEFGRPWASFGDDLVSTNVAWWHYRAGGKGIYLPQTWVITGNPREAEAAISAGAGGVALVTGDDATILGKGDAIAHWFQARPFPDGKRTFESVESLERIAARL